MISPKRLDHFRDHHPPAVVNGEAACLRKSAPPRERRSRERAVPDDHQPRWVVSRALPAAQVLRVTTDSRQNLPVYPNLARDITPDGLNQFWRADITYIRLRTQFVYLAVVLDAHSQRVIGWALGRIDHALRQHHPEPGLVDHSDRGGPYASREYRDLLQQLGAQISMSPKGNPYDNAACELFMKTLNTKRCGAQRVSRPGRCLCADR